MQTLFTIGYEKAKPDAVSANSSAPRSICWSIPARSRPRAGPVFPSAQLAASLDEIGIAYLHLQKLGTPAEGRQAARSGDFDTLWRIYDKHIKTRGGASRARRIARR